MIIFSIILILICIVEFVIILWLNNTKKTNKDIKETIDFFKTLWGKFIFYVLATSIIGLFLGSVFFNQIIELDVINNWVSIVLGLVALIIGIISLFLSFYNVEQSNSTQEKTVDIITDFQFDMIDRMNQLQTNVEHKIDESGEKTRAEINGKYENTVISSKIENSDSMVWEDMRK